MKSAVGSHVRVFPHRMTVTHVLQVSRLHEPDVSVELVCVWPLRCAMNNVFVTCNAFLRTEGNDIEHCLQAVMSQPMSRAALRTIVLRSSGGSASCTIYMYVPNDQ